MSYVTLSAVFDTQLKIEIIIIILYYEMSKKVAASKREYASLTLYTFCLLSLVFSLFVLSKIIQASAPTPFLPPISTLFSTRIECPASRRE